MFVERSSFWSLVTRKKIFFIKCHIGVCCFKNMSKILDSVKKSVFLLSIAVLF
jgi:hypothetical protein